MRFQSTMTDTAPLSAPTANKCIRKDRDSQRSSSGVPVMSTPSVSSHANHSQLTPTLKEESLLKRNITTMSVGLLVFFSSFIPLCSTQVLSLSGTHERTVQFYSKPELRALPCQQLVIVFELPPTLRKQSLILSVELEL